jgi:hypothetical protein
LKEAKVTLPPAVLRTWIITLYVGVTGCNNSQPTPIDRLCGMDAHCRSQAEHADSRQFKTALEAARFGLAWLHYKYPNVESAGMVFKENEGVYVFELGGVGERYEADFPLSPKALIFVHTHMEGERRCSTHDEALTFAVNTYLDHTVRAFVQNRSDSMVECTPVKHPELPIRIPEWEPQEPASPPSD